MLPDRLQPFKTTRSFAKGQILFSHGDAADQFWMVETGWVKLYRTSPDGKETVLGLCTIGDSFGEAALVHHAIYPYSAAVACDAKIAMVAQPVLHEQIQSSPDLSIRLMERLHDRMRQHQRLLDQTQSLTAAQRVGCFLLRLCDLAQQDGNPDQASLTLPLDKHVLAASLSMKPETFSRALGQLRDVGIDGQGEKITVQSIKDLQHFACQACSELEMCLGTKERPQ